ncbi:hypothetical protein [Methylorubrum rhodesianum]|jgi:hypothetical protein|uniref:hypothetical protein n=1 Tax=Methylorubrum rhodesianum TaxID=29427 RepID=UPI0037451F03
MEPKRTNTTGYMPAVAAIVSIVYFSLPAFAQVTDSRPPADAAAPGSRSDADPGQGSTSEVFFATHDVSGKLGNPLPLEIKLVRTGSISIEAILLLGLPRGVTISDSTNSFSPSDDKGDVDIRTWDLPNIKIMQTDERVSRFSLAVAAIWTSGSGGKTNVATSLVNVSFRPDGPDRTITAGGELRSSETPAAASRETPFPPQVTASAVAPDSPARTETVVVPSAQGTPLTNTAEIDRSASPAVPEKRVTAEGDTARLTPPVETARPTGQADPLVERARGLIRLGDISGARLLLERAQARNAPNATFLLAQTWDPDMLRRWHVRGLRADPDLARSLYAKAASQRQTDERLLAATGR